MGVVTLKVSGKKKPQKKPQRYEEKEKALKLLAFLVSLCFSGF